MEGLLTFVLYWLGMRRWVKDIIFLLAFLPTGLIHSQDVFRFEHIGSESGLSQNTSFCILFDSKGFMWIGTMNGLNRYDGYEFKIFKSQAGHSYNFTNNRITRLWEDNLGFIWLETYDGYCHFFDPQSEIFTTLPAYQVNNPKNVAVTSFLQYSDDLVFLGTTTSGMFLLRYNEKKETYDVEQFIDRGTSPLSNNHVRFVHKDENGGLWVGTERGICFMPQEILLSERPRLRHLYVNSSFTSVCEDNKELWFGTEGEGILIYEKTGGHYRFLSRVQVPEMPSNTISKLYYTRGGQRLVCFRDKGVMVTDSGSTSWYTIPFHGSTVTGIYEDRFLQVWLTGLEFGITRYDPANRHTRYYVVTPEESRHLTDLERPQFFEDRNNTLWIGFHGSGLARYDKANDRFEFFMNDPKDPNSISSNIVHSIVEDHSGQIWLGTGQFLGGIEKLILRNTAMEHHRLVREGVDVLDNVARAVLEDSNRFIWAASKAGRLHLFDSTFRQVTTHNVLPCTPQNLYRTNTYALFNDSDGFLWVGSKGDGLSVSTTPLLPHPDGYRQLAFINYRFDAGDTTSLGNNNIYAICEDRSGSIWIATYGNGLNMVTKPRAEKLSFIRINQANSNLSSNLVRHIYIDASGNLWIATTFGLNFLSRENIESRHYHFRVFLHDPLISNSLSYNDVVHIYEDSRGRMWFGTFGGGVNLLEQMDDHTASFKQFTPGTELSNEIIYGIVEDNDGFMWFSTENGLIRLDMEKGNAELYNQYNGLSFSSFSENTCFRRKDGTLIFGGYLGLAVVHPDKLSHEPADSRVELTNFMVFNKEVPINAPGSPLKKSISYTESIHLKYNQSSFSIDFSALDFLDPAKVHYSYKLENFEDDWNDVGNQRKATYTNLSPGKYIFRVRSTVREGIWNAGERRLFIRIYPPWWKTFPAYIVYLLLISAIIFIIYKTATRMSRYRNELLVEKKVNDLKLQFFTNISHEIRTPLSVIIGPIEDILSGDSLPQNSKILMEIIRKNARRMLHLTNQLLDFRKVQSNKMVLKVKEVDIVPFCHDIFESFIPLSQHKGIEYTFHSNINSLVITADPSKLDTVVYNIISNAIKFTPSGKKVSVNIYDSENSNTLDITITDEGPGIPQKNMADIFTRYTILNNEELAGTGIGLSLSYELVKLHKGDILLSSAEGKGSTFTVRLLKGKDHLADQVYEHDGVVKGREPRLWQQGTLNHDMEWQADINEPCAGTNMMLIIEDNQEILNYLSYSLRSTFNCITARNGNEGLHIARSMNPDIILTDIMMPGMDGMEMTRLLKEDLPTCHIPVIMLTSKTEMKDQIAGIETGAEAYIVKPFNIEYLKTVACNLLNQRKNLMAWFTGAHHLSTGPLNLRSKDELFLKEAIAFIEKNYSTGFDMDQLARHCGVSRTVFYNKIKGLTGTGPLEFVRKIKMNIARQLLEKGYNVSEVAYQTGFSDVKYFSRQFKAFYGYSPSRHKNVTG